MISLPRTERQFVKRVDRLVAKLLDDRIQDNEWQELQVLLTSSAAARRAYVQAMLLQAELHYLSKRA